MRAYVLELRTPLSVFTGLGIAGLVDRTVMRKQDRLPVVPGSTVKGRWRFFAERLLLSGALPAPLKAHAPHEPACKRIDEACTLCRLFGSPAMAALLQVGPAELEAPEAFHALLARNRNPVVHPDAELRPGIALSRHRRAALRDHLFFDEAVPPVRFRGGLHLRATISSEEQRFLKAAASLVDAIGARKAAGRGALVNGIQVED